MGNNCEDWLIRISQLKDITVCTTGVDMQFYGKDNIEAYCLNNKKYLHGWREWVTTMLEYMA